MRAKLGDPNSGMSLSETLQAQHEMKTRSVSETEFMENEKMESADFKQVLNYFIKHAYKDIFRRKFHFILAFCSVFLVVVSTLVINQIISKGSIIFLKIGESSHGEIDAFITPAAGIVKETIDKVEYDMGALLNYTSVNEYYQETDPSVLNTMLISPRKVFSGVKVLTESSSGLYGKSSVHRQQWH